MVSFKKLLKKVLPSDKPDDGENASHPNNDLDPQQQPGTTQTKTTRKKKRSVKRNSGKKEKGTNSSTSTRSRSNTTSHDTDQNTNNSKSDSTGANSNGRRGSEPSRNGKEERLDNESEEREDNNYDYYNNNKDEEEESEDSHSSHGEGESDEEDEDDDGFLGTFAMEFEPTSAKQSNDNLFACLSPEDIISEQQKEIKSVSDLFYVTPGVAAALLRHFQWKKEKLIQRYLENPEQVRKEAGVALDNSGEISLGHSNILSLSNNPQQQQQRGVEDHSSSPIPSTTSTSTSTSTPPMMASMMCSICGDDLEEGEWTSLKCNHRFCNDCWRRFLTMKITEGEVTRIKCPHIKCNLVVDENTVKKLVDEETYEKFLRFITKSFVEQSEGRVKWCPQPNCQIAITSDMIMGTIVKCICGYRFCFTCHKEAHAPASCEQVKLWDQKCKDDSETTHWKYAHTKECPKCDSPVEKNGGCNHMTCRQCKHEWCWVCIRPWKGHNDFYNCNKFLQPAKKRTSLFGSLRGRVLGNSSSSSGNNSSSSNSSINNSPESSRKKDKKRERELERERHRLALERYLHYYERYANHSHSGELERQIRNRAITRMSELQKEGATTSSEVQYIVDGTEELLECRNVLKYTYVFAYYLPESGAAKELFEYLQQDLEKTTEQLSEILEAPHYMPISSSSSNNSSTSNNQSSTRLKALNIIQLAKTRKNNLLDAVEQGLTEELQQAEYSSD